MSKDSLVGALLSPVGRAWMFALASAAAAGCGSSEDAVLPGTGGSGGMTSDAGTPPAGCAAGQTLCTTSCVLTQSDPNNCGACGQVCGVGMFCQAGVCSCPAPLASCQGQCVNTTQDPNNCGACGIACQSGQACQAGVCQCQLGLTSCGGACIDVTSDGSNCGACGNACPAPLVCSGGICTASCAPGETQCGNGCVNVATSPLNCGACGNVCTAGTSCIGGTCSCPVGQVACAGACVDPLTNSAHCGTCGTVCAPGQTCQSGQCVCPAGQTLCNGACANTLADPNHCGGCGIVCAAGQSCVSGTCTGATGAGGSSSTGGATAIGGVATTGGQTSTGGALATGGQTSTGGALATGGQTSTGGITSTGGAATGGLATGGAPSTGGAATGGQTSTGGAATGGETSTGGAATGGAATGGTTSTGGTAGSCARPVGSCSAPTVNVTTVSLGFSVASSGGTSDTANLPLAIAAMPSGGSRLAALSSDGVHVAELDCDDQLVGTPFTVPAVDLQDIIADDAGGVVLVTRNATNGGTDNCGSGQLCGGTSSPCRTMWMVRFNAAGQIEWETQVTNLSSSLAGYQNGARFIWWYQHHGRLAFSGTNYAAIFGVAITVNNGSCVDIHEGDRLQLVSSSGALVSAGSKEVCMSHAWTSRVLWDERTSKFMTTDATDNNCRIVIADQGTTIAPGACDGTLFNGDVVKSTTSGYWNAWSQGGNIRLEHFTTGASDQTISNAGSSQHPHLVSYGANNMLLTWGSGSSQAAQVRNAGSGATVGSQFTINVADHPYHAYKSYEDGSVAFPSGSGSSVNIARVMPCSG